MKTALFATLYLLILFSSFTFSQNRSRETKVEKIITVCSIEFLGIGKNLDWRFSFTYNFTTDRDGSVKNLKQIQTSKRMSSFLNQNKILDCIKSWKLKPQDKYQVELITGNILVNTSFSIQSEKEKIKYFYDTMTFEFSTSKNESNSQKEFNICSPKLTESGQQSAFRFGYRYIIQTDKEGLAKKVDYLKSEYNYESLADSSGVVPCLKQWKLSSSSKYRIYISFGTTGGSFLSLTISNKDELIKILL